MSEEQNRYRIVVGVSARSTSPTALRWANDLAQLRDGEVLAVRAWKPVPQQAGSRGTPSMMTADLKAAEEAEAQRLADDVAGVLGPDHLAGVQLLIGGKRRSLLAAAEGADLLVIDAPRRLEFEAAPGFVQRLIHASRCPVVVVPRSLSGAPPSTIARAAEAVGRSVAGAAGRAPRPGMGHLQNP